MASINVNFDENTVSKLVDERLIVENAELKRLLKIAMEDLAYIGSCANCAHDHKLWFCECTECNVEACAWKWKHAAEAEKLLGGGESHD